jgi:hypothetical protein
LGVLEGVRSSQCPEEVKIIAPLYVVIIIAPVYIIFLADILKSQCPVVVMRFTTYTPTCCKRWTRAVPGRHSQRRRRRIATVLGH